MNTNKLGRWNTKQTIKFLTIFESYESLWNMRHEDYTKKKKREENFKKLLEDMINIGLMNKTADLKLLRAKIKSLKDAFRQEVIKVATSKTLATKSDDIYTPKLAWFENARFWIDFMGTRPSFIPLSASQIIQDPPEMKIEIDEESEHLEVPEFVACTDSLEAAVKSEPIIDEDQSMHDLKSVAGYNTAREAQEDACNFFGKYVAAELRSLPIKARMEVQQEIQSCITAAVIRNSTGSKATETAQVPNTSAGPSST
ncbi:uncharacterized protein LOC123315282 isoform X2 [Coccinella septempunctata]|uniref:uncharacterized protein LOC123315282 isoform X2 n=1 Tax=Coccinella septempunctata TaxID=41139 RepID=UPI001D092AC7|nr:uncharacterized protein LOC123315282 isoform X2 [Coccinella septempunctata]